MQKVILKGIRGSFISTSLQTQDLKGAVIINKVAEESEAGVGFDAAIRRIM